MSQKMEHKIKLYHSCTLCAMPSSPAFQTSDVGSFLLPVYHRADLTIVEGEGAWLIGEDGRRYLDFSSGVAVVNLGHRHPAVTRAAAEQLNRVWHTSNHYWTEPMLVQGEGGVRPLSARFIEASAGLARRCGG